MSEKVVYRSRWSLTKQAWEVEVCNEDYYAFASYGEFPTLELANQEVERMEKKHSLNIDENKRTFWQELEEYIKENTMSHEEFVRITEQVYYYIKGVNGIIWEDLDINAQEILVDFDIITPYGGIVPENAQLNHAIMGF